MLSNVWGYVTSCAFSLRHLVAHRGREPVAIEDVGFDIVTVVCLQDLPLLRLQARSVALYLDAAFSGTIYLIVNDLQQDKVVSRIRDTILPSYGPWRPRVKIIPYFHLGHGLDPTNGWKIQQALKLSVAFALRRSFYVVLDSKNHLVRDVRVTDFVTERGIARQNLDAHESTLDVHAKTCAHFLGLRPEDVGPCWPMTPFVFHTQTARDLVARLERRAGCSIFSMFRRIRLLSEFLLYKTHLRIVETEGDAPPYEAGPMLCRTIWPGQCVASAIADSEGDSGLLMFGVHRDVVRDLAEDDRRLLHRFWRKCGLIDPVLPADDEREAPPFDDRTLFSEIYVT